MRNELTIPSISDTPTAREAVQETLWAAGYNKPCVHEEQKESNMLPRSNKESDSPRYGHGRQYTPYAPYNSVEEYGPGQSNDNATLMTVAPQANEFDKNQEERCPILLCLDRSGSMNGRPMEELAAALEQFSQDLREDPSVAARVDVGVITFNEMIQWVDFTNSTEFNPPQLHAEGGTKMSFAMQVSLDMCERRKDIYRQNGITYHRPWIVLITDGYPDHDGLQEITEIQERLKGAEENRRAAIFTVACGEESGTLAEWLTQNVTPPNRPAKRTSEANFKELFKWLSNSQIAISKSTPGERVELPSTDGWEIV